MSVIEQRFQGLTAAEFTKAERLFRWAGGLQIAVTAVAAVSIFVGGDTYTLLLAVLSSLLYAGWVAADWTYRDSREQAERGRRYLWIADGLGDPLSNGERREIEAGFSVSSDAGKAAANPEFFAATTKPGKRRLAELVEESGFYSCRLYRLSARITWTKFAGVMLVSILLFLSSVAIASTEQLVAGARLICTLLVFLVGNEVMGMARAYNRAHSNLSTLQARLRLIEQAGFPEGDLLMIVGDYNSAVEGAPLMAPGVYRKNAKHLDELWRRHQSSDQPDG